MYKKIITFFLGVGNLLGTGMVPKWNVGIQFGIEGDREYLIYEAVPTPLNSPCALGLFSAIAYSTHSFKMEI